MGELNNKVRKIMRDIAEVRIEFNKMRKDPGRLSKNESQRIWEERFDVIAEDSLRNAIEILRNFLGAVDE